MRFLGLVLCASTLCGCVSAGHRVDALAQALGLTRSIVQGQGYRHAIYMKQAAMAGAPLVIVLEGDGRPWGTSGRAPAHDPTPRRPLALRLLAQTPAPAVYIGRPCYHDVLDSACSPALWTGARYSDAIVDSMVAATRSIAAQTQASELIIVGYSGGGALAVLMAERLEQVSTVITIAANLDIDAWAAHHKYLPLHRSLNPARSNRAHPWREVHLLGGNDRTVPPATTAAYFERYPQAQRIVLDEYEHVCCWIDAWPKLFEQTTGAGAGI